MGKSMVMIFWTNGCGPTCCNIGCQPRLQSNLCLLGRANGPHRKNVLKESIDRTKKKISELQTTHNEQANQLEKLCKRNQELTSNETDLLHKITELEKIMNSQDGLVRYRPEPSVSQFTTQPTTPVQPTNNNKRVANDHMPIRSKEIKRDPVTGLPLSSTTIARAMSNCDTSQSMMTQQEAMQMASNLILKEKLETAEAELNQSMESKLNAIIKKSVSSKEEPSSSQSLKRTISRNNQVQKKSNVNIGDTTSIENKTCNYSTVNEPSDELIINDLITDNIDLITENLNLITEIQSNTNSIASIEPNVKPSDSNHKILTNDDQVSSTPKSNMSSRVMPYDEHGHQGRPMTSTPKGKLPSQILPSNDPRPITSTPKGKMTSKRSLFDEDSAINDFKVQPMMSSTPKSKPSSKKLPSNEDPNSNLMNIELSLEEIDEISTRNISNHRTLSKTNNTPRLPSSPSSTSNVDRDEALESNAITESRNPSKHSNLSQHDMKTPNPNNTKPTNVTSRNSITEDVPVTMHLRSITNMDPPLSKSSSDSSDSGSSKLPKPKFTDQLESESASIVTRNSIESILTPLSVKDTTETEINEAQSESFEAFFPSDHQILQYESSHQVLAEIETEREQSKNAFNDELSADSQCSKQSLVDQSAPVLLGLQSATRIHAEPLLSLDSTLSSQTLSKSTPSKSTDTEEIEDIENESEERNESDAEDNNEKEIIPALISMQADRKLNPEKPPEASETPSKFKSPKTFDNMASLSIKDTMQVPHMIPEHTFKQNTFLHIPKELKGNNKNRSPVPKLDFSKLESSKPSPPPSPKKPREQQFSFAAWRKRYMQFNNNDKSRVMEQLRALDKCSTGYIPNNDFIDHVLSTGFKTNRKELVQVVRLFDPNYEGRMDYCRFISCLRSIPGPNEDEEFNIMAAKWARTTARYQVESADPEYPFEESHHIRLVRKMKSKVEMVRVGGGWENMADFLFHNEHHAGIKPLPDRLTRDPFLINDGVSQAMNKFSPRTKSRHRPHIQRLIRKYGGEAAQKQYHTDIT